MDSSAAEQVQCQLEWFLMTPGLPPVEWLFCKDAVGLWDAARALCEKGEGVVTDYHRAGAASGNALR